MQKEKNGEDLEINYEFDLELELSACEENIAKIKELIQKLPGDTTTVPPEIKTLLNHTVGRLWHHLPACKDKNRKWCKKLILEARSVRQFLESIVENAGEVLKRIPTISEIVSSQKSELRNQNVSNQRTGEIPNREGPSARCGGADGRVPARGEHSVLSVAVERESLNRNFGEVNTNGDGSGERLLEEVRPRRILENEVAVVRDGLREAKNGVRDMRETLTRFSGLRLNEQINVEPRQNRARLEPLTGNLTLPRSVHDRFERDFENQAAGANGYNSAREPRCGEVRRENPHFVPISKWGKTFSGHGTPNANQFLERVEELAETRGASPQDLFRGALEFLTGEALNWFRVHRHSFWDLDHFKEELKAQFLPPDFEEVLWEEIRNRKQNPGESVCSFLNHMLGLFNQLGSETPESTKVGIVLRNFLPELRMHLCVARPRTLKELQLIDRELDMGMNSVNGILNRRSNQKFPADRERSGYYRNEPAFHEIVKDESKRCFNCSEVGHFARDCKIPRGIKCFGCGRPGVYRPNCRFCQRKRDQKNERAD